jgi:hypothetical protein
MDEENESRSARLTWEDPKEETNADKDFEKAILLWLFWRLKVWERGCDISIIE